MNTAPATDRALLAFAALLGIAAFLLVRGPASLDPTNILWLYQGGDRAMHSLGWWFFRDVPWGWPPGASPRLGIEFSNGVGMADALPLAALTFKLFSPILPEHFQYWGWWHLLSFVLQAVFAVLVARDLGLSRPLAIVAALFCLFQPTYLMRLDAHMALSSHWVLLAALHLYFRREAPPLWAWPLLLTLTAGIHVYLLVMIFVIWLASGLQRLWLRRLGWRGAMAEIGLGLAGIAALLWAGGLLIAAAGTTSDFGRFRMNLLGPLASDGWSTLIPPVPRLQGEWEGLNFLGIGTAGLLLLALLAGGYRLLGRVARPQVLPLLLALLGLAVFSLSHRVALGSIELFELPLPQNILARLGTLRSSGRMFWPLGYMLIFGGLVLLSLRLAQRWAAAAAVALVTVQIADLHVGWQQLYVGPDRAGADWPSPMQSPAWEALAPHYQNLRELPVQFYGAHWRDVSWFALNHGMGTNSVNLARVDQRLLAEEVERGKQALLDGSFDPGAIYLMDEASAVATVPLLQQGDLLAPLDGFIVFARGGAPILEAAGIALPPYLPP